MYESCATTDLRISHAGSREQPDVFVSTVARATCNRMHGENGYCKEITLQVLPFSATHCLVRVSGICARCQEELNIKFNPHNTLLNAQQHTNDLRLIGREIGNKMIAYKILPPEPDFPQWTLLLQGEYVQNMRAQLGPWWVVQAFNDTEYKDALLQDQKINSHLASAPEAV